MKLNLQLSNTMKLVIAGIGFTGFFLLVAMALYPNYNQFDQTISKLGNIGPASFFFSLALLIEAVTLSYLLSKIKDDILILFKDQIKNFSIIYILYNLMILCLIGVVIFPSKGTTSDTHDVIAVTLFILMAIATSWVSFIAETTLENWKKPISYLGYACALSVIILGVLLTFGEFGPIVQKITVLLFNVWVILTGYEIQNYASIKR